MVARTRRAPEAPDRATVRIRCRRPRDATLALKSRLIAAHMNVEATPGNMYMKKCVFERHLPQPDRSAKTPETANAKAMAEITVASSTYHQGGRLAR